MENSAVSINRVRTLDEAIEHQQRAAKLMAGYDSVGSKNAQQLADWLHELRVMRAALNMEPRTVTG